MDTVVSPVSAMNVDEEAVLDCEEKVCDEDLFPLDGRSSAMIRNGGK